MKKTSNLFKANYYKKSMVDHLFTITLHLYHSLLNLSFVLTTSNKLIFLYGMDAKLVIVILIVAFSDQ